MKLVLAAGVLAIATTGAAADPITRYTITGRSSAAAAAQGVPLDQTPKAPDPADPAAAADGGSPGSPGDPAAAPRPRVERYGLLGLSWRSQ